MDKIRVKDFWLRLVDVHDAEFIITLRTDPDLSKHLHQTSPNFDQQKSWIFQYKVREKAGKEFYFIAEMPSGERLGLTRLYNFTDDAFELGSWIFKKGLPESIPVLADIATRDFAFETLGFRKCLFNVRKENKKVVRYHQLYNPKQVGEDTENLFYELDYNIYLKRKEKIAKLFNYG